jgi:hypothetical protein
LTSVQLAQVTQCTHPPGTGASVIERLLAGAQTIPPDRGLFLERLANALCLLVERAER